MDKIRELYIESGAKLSYKPEDWGLNKNEKSIEGIEVYFDYGVPMRMRTPDGLKSSGNCSPKNLR